MRLAHYKREIVVIVIVYLLPFFGALTIRAADDKDLSFPSGENEPVEVGDLTGASINQPDTVFIDIKMSDGAVIGQDTYGNWWQYDFDYREFVAYSPDEFAENSLAEPVEERCTKRKSARMGTYDDLLIGYEEYVDGNVLAFKRIVVSGWVKGDVKSILGEVIVSSTGQVDGKIEAPQVQIKPGGIVSGETVITGPVNLPLDFISRNAMPMLLGVTIMFLFVGYLLISLMPRQLAVVGVCMTDYKLRSLLGGLLTALIIVPIGIVVLALTVIGWMLVPIAGMVAIAMGLVSYGNLFGIKLLSLRDISPRGMMMSSLLGMSTLSLLWFGAVWLAQYPTALVQALGVLSLFAVMIFTAYPVLSGLGAVLLTRFGFYEYIGVHQSSRDEIEPPAPPPLPETPPVIHSPKGQFPKDIHANDSIPPLSSGGE